MLNHRPAIPDIVAGVWVSEAQPTLFDTGEIRRSADFSPCKTYRYTLKRTWESDLPHILWVLLNPSTADAQKDDPTNRKCMTWARKYGYGSLTFVNLFAYRSPYPEVMKAYHEPIGPDNDDWLWSEIRKHDAVVAGWGNGGTHRDRWKEVAPMCVRWMCIGINKNGQPKHPLYMRGDVRLQMWNHPWVEPPGDSQI